MTTISNLGTIQTLTTNLQAEQTTMSTLSNQLASNQQYSNLTQYDPTDAHNILDFQNAITQRQSYVSSIQNVQDRLSLYDSTMTDMESLASQANDLATQNSSYNASTAAGIKSQVTDYLQQLGDDLNQQIGGRYVYAGTRYTTPPVTNLTSLTNAPTATTTTSPALPSYDINYNNATSFTVNRTATGNFTMGNTTIAWSGSNSLANNNTGSVNVTVGSNTVSVPVSGLINGNSPADLATNLQLTLNAVAASTSASSSGVPSTLTASVGSGAADTTVTLNLGGAAPNSVTPDAGGMASETTWVGGSTPSGLVAQTPNSDAAAYTQDTALIDSNYSVTYGVSSDNPSFQQLVNGLRYITSAVTAGQNGDSATYQTDMQQASTLISNGLAGIQALHAGVADNQSALTAETTTQNSDITNLQNQLTNIQGVNLAQVGTEINLMQTQLQASYSATASIEKLSLVTYL